MRGACLRFLEARVERARRAAVALRARVTGAPGARGDRSPQRAERFPELAAELARRRNPEEPYRRAFTLIRAARARDPQGRAGRLRATRASCSPTCAPPSARCSRRARALRRRRRPARRHPPGRGVRLPLRPPRHPRARRSIHRARSHEMLAELGLHEAYDDARPTTSARALLAREIADRRPLIPADSAAFSASRRRRSRRSARCARCSTARHAGAIQAYVDLRHRGPGGPARGAAADEGVRAREGRRRGRAAADRPALRGRRHARRAPATRCAPLLAHPVYRDGAARASATSRR